MPRLPNHVRHKDGKYFYRRTYVRPNGTVRNFRRELGECSLQMRRTLPSVLSQFETERDASRNGIVRIECSLREFSKIWLNEWIEVRRTGQGPGLAKSRVEKMCGFVPGRGQKEFGDCRVIDVGTREILALRGWLAGRGLCSQTIIHYLRDLRCLFGYAEELGAIDRGTNPVRSKMYPKLKSVLPRAVLNQERIDKICENANIWLLCILVARWTGQRWGDCRRLRWEHVRIKERLVGFEVSKNGQTLWLPIPDSFAEVLSQELARQMRDGRSDRVLAHAPPQARDFTRGIVRRCGCQFSMHDFRRYRTSELLEGGVGAETIRQALRWSSVQMVYRYGRVPDAHVLEEISATFETRKKVKRVKKGVNIRKGEL